MRKSNTNIWLIQTCHVFLIASRSNTTKKDQLQDFAPGGSIFNWSQAPGAPGTRRLIPAPGLCGFHRAQDAKRTTQTSESHHPTDASAFRRSDWMIKLSTRLPISSGPVRFSQRKTLENKLVMRNYNPSSQVFFISCSLMAPEACPRLGSVWKVWRNPLRTGAQFTMSRFRCS